MSEYNEQENLDIQEQPEMSEEEIARMDAEREAALERELAPFRAFRRKVNAGLRAAISAGKVDDEEVEAIKESLPPWVQGSIENPITYIEGDAYVDEGLVWIVKQTHPCTSSVEKPSVHTLALWRRATPEGVAMWQENTDYIGPNDAQGRPQSEVIDPFDKKNYLCLQGHTALAGWEPSKTAALWQLKG